MNKEIEIPPLQKETIESKVKRLEAQLLFTIEDASFLLGGMAESTIRTHVHAGRSERCLHLGEKPWYFTRNHLHNFINNRIRVEQNEN